MPDRDVTLAVFVVIVAMTVILAPWWLRLGRGLTEERAERIRTQERAELAAHLHDSVLQTLALMQKRAARPARGRRARPAPGARAARVAERRLARRSAASRSPAALEAAVAEIEDAHGVPIEVVAVGDRPLDERATRWSPPRARRSSTRSSSPPTPRSASTPRCRATASRCSCATAGRASTSPPCPADRRGLRESVLGRMERHGGRAEIHTRPGAGTEVELVMEP